MSGILSGPAILEEIEAGNIIIDPFDAALHNPASFDLRLGPKFGIYVALDDTGARQKEGVLNPMVHPYVPVLDSAVNNQFIEIDIPVQGLLLKPGVLYLMHTAERIWTTKYVPILDGKSSIGRLGICVHLTAGFGDPGFDGQYTLEVTCVSPVRIYAGMRFCQMRFHSLEGPILSYQRKGSYVGHAARGPVPSRSWQQFLANPIPEETK